MTTREWRRRLQRDGLPHGPGDWMFCNPAGRYLNPQSLSQLFARLNARSVVPKIRMHDRGTPMHRCSSRRARRSRSSPERRGHSHPAFTMHTYQHLLPGMSAEAATRFAGLVAAASR